MQLFINQLLEDIKADYIRWGRGRTPQDMIDEFNAGLRTTEGKKYIKIIQRSSVWGFIVKEDGGKFRKGDILKPAGWNQPATNQARGNIIDGGYAIQWTGPMYLR